MEKPALPLVKDSHPRLYHWQKTTSMLKVTSKLLRPFKPNKRQVNLKLHRLSKIENLENYSMSGNLKTRSFCHRVFSKCANSWPTNNNSSSSKWEMLDRARFWPLRRTLLISCQMRHLKVIEILSSRTVWSRDNFSWPVLSQKMTILSSNFPRKSHRRCSMILPYAKNFLLEGWLAPSRACLKSTASSNNKPSLRKTRFYKMTRPPWWNLWARILLSTNSGPMYSIY